jgi:glycosyltransferase involved in cell wall biosynthesis
MAGALIATAPHEPVALEDLREPVRVVIASLALGGAERIVVEWLAAEAAAGRACELAVLHPRRIARRPPKGVAVRLRAMESPQDFVRALARDWTGARAPLSTHLIGDELLAILWAAGLATVPVVHNAAPGWRNDARFWRAPHVPQAVACAGAVAAELRAHGATVPVAVIRHRPCVGGPAFDPAARARVRAALGIGPDCLVVLAAGAIKPQKDYVRAIGVLRALAARRDCVLVIAGGTLDAQGLAELDRVVDAAQDAGVIGRLRLPGFVDPIEPWLAAADMLLNVSRFEGLSMAVREALAAGVPVVATAVGGQEETRDERLRLVDAEASAEGIADHCAALPVRQGLVKQARTGLPRAWSMTLASRAPSGTEVRTLLVTANLNAGGAQRSLVNLAAALAARHRLAVAVCGPSTQSAFAASLHRAGVHAFRPAPSADPFAQAESLLAWSAAHGVRTLVFWNLDARVKLLVARFAPDPLRLIDVSPGHYSFEEIDAAAAFGEALDYTPAQYHARLAVLVHKHHGAWSPPGVRTTVIPNGVATREACAVTPAAPRFLVSGRIAPSKQLDLILDAFGRVRASFPSAELHVVGQAEARHADLGRHIESRAKRVPGVVLRGACPDLAFLAEPFTAAVVLGRHQGSPNAVLEACSAGIPVIANASGGTGEIVQGGRTGWLLDEACDVDALATAMREAAADPDRTRALGAAARAFVAERHGMQAMVEAYRVLVETDTVPMPATTIEASPTASRAPASAS